MPHRLPRQTKTKAGISFHPSPPNVSPAPKSGRIAGGTPTKKRKKSMIPRNDPLFAFDAAKEEFNWGRPKRKIKSISRFDPTREEKQSECKIGHGFICPRCSAICSYDSRACYNCHLECCYEAGVGVVVLQDRRVNYKPSNKKASGEKRASATTTEGKTRESTKEKVVSSAVNNEGSSGTDKPSSSATASSHDNNGLEKSHKNQSNFFIDAENSRKKENIFTNLKEQLKVATAKSNSDSQQEGGNDDSTASRVEEATLKWTECTIPASKDGAYSSASSDPPISADDLPIAEEVAAEPKEHPSLENDINVCQELKEQLLALQLKYDSIIFDATKAEEEFKESISKLEVTILQRNKDAAAFSETISSSSSRIAEIWKRVGLLTTERNEFVQTVEAKGLSSVPKIVPNYSTRIDALQTKTSQMKSECDAAKERVKDLMSGTEAAKQEKEKAAKDLEEMETKHGETFTQCYKEIESFKQQLSDATAKIATMAAEKAELVENVSCALIHVSKVRSKAETQANKISELESSLKSLALHRDAAVEQCEKDIARLSDERDEAVTKSKTQTTKISELESSVKSLALQRDAVVEKCKEYIARLSDEKAMAVAKSNTQTTKISELESSVESLALQRDAAVEKCKKDIARLSDEKAEAVVKSKGLEDTVNELRFQIQILKSQAKTNDTKY